MVYKKQNILALLRSDEIVDIEIPSWTNKVYLRNNTLVDTKHVRDLQKNDTFLQLFPLEIFQRGDRRKRFIFKDHEHHMELITNLPNYFHRFIQLYPNFPTNKVYFGKIVVNSFCLYLF